MLKENVKLTEEDHEEVEGYAYCDSHKERCLNDCIIGDDAFISDLN